MRRIEQVNDLIREELGKITDRNIELPEGAMMTITRVVTSSDLHYADVFVSIMPHADEAGALEVLIAQVGTIQHRLNRQLRMRPVPRIKFVVDTNQKRADRIEKLLAEDRLKNEDE